MTIFELSVGVDDNTGKDVDVRDGVLDNAGKDVDVGDSVVDNAGKDVVVRDGVADSIGIGVGFSTKGGSKQPVNATINRTAINSNSFFI